MLTFLNVKGGFGGSRLEFYTQEMDDTTPNFPARLNTMILQSQPIIVVGGAVSTRSGETADYFRRTGLVWFGPWSQWNTLYRGAPDDPVGLIPSPEDQIDLLFDHVARRLGAGTQIMVINQEFEGRSDLSSQSVKQAADKYGLSLNYKVIDQKFRDWVNFKDQAQGAAAILLWVPSGPAAALVRTLKPVLPKETLFLTHALNPPGVELWDLTTGLWEGMIFPSILFPDSIMVQAYDGVINHYGPKGLNPSYLSYLGVAQAQIMARSLMNLSPGNKNEAVRKALNAEDGGGTMLTNNVVFGTGLPPKSSAFLAVVTKNRNWKPLGAVQNQAQ
jgi:ABC-type branched-subunit amino acid transport system substrate-binding protein